MLRALIRTMSEIITGKQVAPSAERNKGPIAEVLKEYFPDDQVQGKCLEVASGTGQHVVHWASTFPKMTFQPTEYDASKLPSIKAYMADHQGKNIQEPIQFDMSGENSWERLPPDWSHPEGLNLVLAVNVIHISPWSATQGLLALCGRVLKPEGFLVTYGPYLIDGKPTSESNGEFDASLKSRNPEWGIRDIADVEEEAAKHGIALIKQHPMPANNFTMTWKKVPLTKTSENQVSS